MRLVEGGTVQERLHIRIDLEGRPPMVTNFSVAYELEINGISYQPLRIDNAHGEVHMDILDAAGVRVRREALGHMEPRDMVTVAREQVENRITHHRQRIFRELGLSLEEERGDENP